MVKLLLITFFVDLNSNFGQKFQFWIHITIFHTNFPFGQKCQFWTKISILDKNFNFPH